MENREDNIIYKLESYVAMSIGGVETLIKKIDYDYNIKKLKELDYHLEIARESIGKLIKELEK